MREPDLSTGIAETRPSQQGQGPSHTRSHSLPVNPRFRQRVNLSEPLAVGDSLPDMPLFLTTDLHVRVPLETTYQATWNSLPEEMRTAVETGELPDPDLEETAS